MRYTCIQCGAGGASAHNDPHPSEVYNCHECPGEGTMWPKPQADMFRSTFAAYNRANRRQHMAEELLRGAQDAHNDLTHDPDLWEKIEKFLGSPKL